MPTLYGQSLSRRELLERIGDIRQVGGVCRVQRTEGVERGLEVIEVRTGAGLDFDLLPSRGLDIGAALVFGRSLAWHSASGFPLPERVDVRTQEGFHRGFGGGLLTTCGLSNVGEPCEDEGIEYTQHGMAMVTPAFDVCASGEWQGDEYAMMVRGRTREAGLYADKLEKTRTVTTRLGEARLELEDVVENIGAAPCALMILYHVNVGWPLLAPGAAIEARSEAREVVLGNGRGWNEVAAPCADYETNVIEHRIAPDGDGMARVTLRSGAMRIELAYDAAALPRFTQWRQYGAGDYVLGLEPGNVGVRGRAWERANGSLPMLAPGETRTFRMNISAALDGAV